MVGTWRPAQRRPRSVTATSNERRSTPWILGLAP